MSHLTPQLLSEIVRGRLKSGSAADGNGEIRARVVTDSRQVQTGDVFFALPGRRHNGADFAEDAYARGAVGVVAQTVHIEPPEDRWLLSVDDASAALWQWAHWKRRRFSGTVIGVTGSVGKTTTQRMIHSVLRGRLSGSTSPHSFNNHVGVPLGILTWRDDDDYAVLELGASAAGEIAALSELSAPRVGVITEVGDAHLDGFGDYEGVARAKIELLSALPHYGHAIVNGDRKQLRRLVRGVQTNIVWFGRGIDSDVRADDVRSAGGTLRFCVEGHLFTVPVWGRHHLSSALATVAVGRVCGLDWEEIADGLSRFEPAPMRCQVRDVHGASVIQDTYNASPMAMRAALDLLRDFDSSGRRIVVCGDMRELGKHSTALHRGLGIDVVSRSGADLLIACGDHADEVVHAAQEAGMSSDATVACRTPDECVPHLAGAWAPGDVILVKGSRAMAMERVVDALERSTQRQAA